MDVWRLKGIAMGHGLWKGQQGCDKTFAYHSLRSILNHDSESFKLIALYHLSCFYLQAT